MEFLAQFGYPGLLASSFLAATLLPLSSEVVLSALLLAHFNPALCLGVATTGNVLGSWVNYAAGYHGSRFVTEKLLRMTPEEVSTARQRLERYGTASLLFAWVPVIGDPLTFAAGMLKVHPAVFFIFVAAGKLIRYILIIYAVT